MADLNSFLPAQGWLNKGDSTLLLLVAVVWIAIRRGQAAGIAATAVGVLGVNYFFQEPYYSLRVADAHDLLTLVVFAVTALVIGQLAARAREEAGHHRRQAEITRQRSHEVEVLHAVSERVAAIHQSGQLQGVIEAEIGPLLQLPAPLALLTPDTLATLAEAEQAAAGAALSQQQATGRGTGQWDQSAYVFVPLTTSDGAVGTLAAGPLPPAVRLDPNSLRLLTAAASQIGVAYERARLIHEVGEARILAESERFRAVLLSSISHDFRTPLGSILGAASTLLTAPATLGEDTRRELLLTIRNSTERLNRYVRNLLDLTVIESGAVAPAREWVDLGDIIGSALRSLEPALASRPLTIRGSDSVPLVSADFVLIERVIVNVLENALKFSPPGAEIAINVSRTSTPQGEQAVIAIVNQGSDVPPEQLPHLFDKFFRAESARPAGGVGLGLSICRGFMAAHGGSIEAQRMPERGGMCFRLILPILPGGPEGSDLDE